MSDDRRPLQVLAPVPGTVVAMADVPDPVFAAALVGPGVAVDPSRSLQRAVSPIGGRIVKLHPHAFVVVTQDGRGVLVHLGIDTVQLKGQGFTLLAAEGDEVASGAPVVEWDPAAVEAGGRSPVCPVVALDAAAGDLTVVVGRRRGRGGGRALHVVLTSPAGAVFDLDGTLVLTEGRNVVVWRSFFEANGIGYNDDLAHHVMGRRAQDSMVELMHLFPGRPIDELVREVTDIDKAVPLGNVQAVAGAVQLVRRLADAGMPLALVTSAGRVYADDLLGEIGLPDSFATKVTGEDVSRGKPDPEGYLAACAGLGLAPALVVGFEDSRAGVAAVKSAGMSCVAVATTQPRELLAAADIVIADFEDLEPVSWLREVAGTG